LAEFAKRRIDMPEMRILKRARKALRESKAPMTAAGEFVREEIEQIRQGKHRTRSPKQIIALGLAKARRAARQTPKRVGAKTRLVVEREVKGAKKTRRISPRRSRAALLALKRQGRKAASTRTLSRAARRAGSKRKGPRRAATGARSRARKSMRRSSARSMR
jgi:hypothetical protein